MKTKCLIIMACCLIALKLQAHTIQLGQIEFTGAFTLNHNYNFNESLTPFGTFGIQAVQASTGIFSPYVSPSNTLAMNIPFFYVSTGTTPVPIPFNGVFFGSLAQPMQWTIGGFTIDTLWDVITGPDNASYCLGLTNLSGNGFNPADYGLGAFSYWDFTAPPYDISNFHSDVSGPISLTFIAVYNDGRVPESGPGLIGLLALVGFFGVCSYFFRPICRVSNPLLSPVSCLTQPHCDRANRRAKKAR